MTTRPSAESDSAGPAQSKAPASAAPSAKAGSPEARAAAPAPGAPASPDLAPWPPLRPSSRSDHSPASGTWTSAVVAGALVLALLLLLVWQLSAPRRTAAPITTVPSGPPPAPFRDCEQACPWMVKIPPGRFLMGSDSGEVGHHDDEGPLHVVSIRSAFAAGEYPITRGEWRQYVKATGHPTQTGCGGGVSWLNPGFQQDDRHPVVCVSWNEAEAYASWLSQKTGHHYRLLSEAEYEYINRAGTSTPYFWGYTSDGQCRYANGDDPSAGCTDGYPYTSPVGSFKPNAFGLYDTTGNVLSWTQDCWHGSYRGAPTDGSAWTTGGNCAYRVLRGGAWNNVPEGLRSAFRVRTAAQAAYNYQGLRVARNP